MGVREPISIDYQCVTNTGQRENTCSSFSALGRRTQAGFNVKTDELPQPD